jgi:transcriptional regulator with XRE-family HTH domain
MNIGEQIKRIRTAKGLSQKEVILASGLDKAQFSRIENSKTDPSFSTLERIANAMGISLAELFVAGQDFKEVDSLDKSVLEKVSLIESLTEEEKKTVFSIVDAFIGKKKLKDALGSVLQSVE